MSKREYDTAFLSSKRTDPRRERVKKHTLDSDEEDNVDEDNVLDTDDIEGEEEGVDRQEGEQKMTAFNMKEEMEEGHFDKEGHFIWKNEKEIRDNWLDNIDWQKIKSTPGAKEKYGVDERDESDSESEPEEEFDEIGAYKKMLNYMKPKETVNKALKRLGGADMKLSSVERLRRKKAGTLQDNKEVTELTELANQILTKLGNMDIYQETYEQIKAKVDRSEMKNKSVAKEAELDMYADDFDVKEKEREKPQTETSDQAEPETKVLKWEFKWKIEDTEVQGPYSTAQMVKWAKEKYFKDGVMVRKCGENSNFYTSNRIDFELYE
ncbi:unnamed protein product [Acanthoscelides obtectus]|uniref:GYF domain-containing protein n=1 Tax=Acanthoscelides obtectus TaxID=200917 RepID=A0A9P0P6J3_ACAOB|nr:unnamed protein product [Acanthoscelides obtectus]CAK1635731.1 CD2 antigen cytoplasmic tail-binding protein 2 homolog [Acanthoscelides obtectus]